MAFATPIPVAVSSPGEAGPAAADFVPYVLDRAAAQSGHRDAKRRQRAAAPKRSRPTASRGAGKDQQQDNVADLAALRAQLGIGSPSSTMRVDLKPPRPLRRRRERASWSWGSKGVVLNCFRWSLVPLQVGRGKLQLGARKHPCTRAQPARLSAA